MANSSLTPNSLAPQTHRPRGIGWVLYPIGGVVTYIVVNVSFILLALLNFERLMDGGSPPTTTQMLSLYSISTCGASIGVPALIVYAAICSLLVEPGTYPSTGTTFWRPVGITVLIALVVALVGMFVP